MRSFSANRFYGQPARKLGWGSLSTAARRLIVAIIGGLVLLVGLAMIVLPGPAFVVVPLGLGILSTEFSWARRWLHKARTFFKQAAHKARSSLR